MFMKRQKYLKVSVYVFLLFIALGISGCATSMPLTKDTKKLNFTKETIGIMSLKISNKHVPGYQPNVKIIEVLQIDTASKKTFEVEEAFHKVENEFNEYLLSFQLPPGFYKIWEVGGNSGIFPVSGTFRFPMGAEFGLDSNTITYIGHVEMVNRERKDGEPRSGSIFPLIDQSVTGFSVGTFDITISDRYLDDVKLFKAKYPAIDGYEVKKNIAIIR